MSRTHLRSHRRAPRGACATSTLAIVLSSLLATATPHAASPQNAASERQSIQAATSTHARVFASDAGIVLNFIKPDKTSDFEAIVGRLREALQKSHNPERKHQAASWKVFRASEPAANGSVLYVFVIDPAVKGQDYTVSTILAEAFPSEVQSLYKMYAESYASGQNVVNLSLLSALSQ